MVLLYGMLKRSQFFHYKLHEENKGTARFVGHGRTTETYPLVVIKEYGCPFLLNVPGQGKVSY